MTSRAPEGARPSDALERPGVIKATLLSYDGLLRMETITVDRDHVVVVSGSRREGRAPLEAAAALFALLSEVLTDPPSVSDKETRNHLPYLLLQAEWQDGHEQEVLDIRNQGEADLRSVEQAMQAFLRSVSWD